MNLKVFFLNFFLIVFFRNSTKSKNSTLDEFEFFAIFSKWSKSINSTLDDFQFFFFFEIRLSQ